MLLSKHDALKKGIFYSFCRQYHLMRGTYSRVEHSFVFHDNLWRKINLSNEIGLSTQYATQWDATSFLFIDPRWIKARFLNAALQRGSRCRKPSFNPPSTPNPPLFPFDSRIRCDHTFELDNLRLPESSGWISITLTGFLAWGSSVPPVFHETHKDGYTTWHVFCWLIYSDQSVFKSCWKGDFAHVTYFLRSLSNATKSLRWGLKIILTITECVHSGSVFKVTTSWSCFPLSFVVVSPEGLRSSQLKLQTTHVQYLSQMSCY